MTTLSTQDLAHAEVCKLVNQFQVHEKTYFDKSYQETQLRSDFLDKFFIALGWDVTHIEQTNPYAQEVTIEKRVKTGLAKRRADYAFSIPPHFRRPQFYVEAKKPSDKLATADNYFQAIRYSWNTQLPLVVLTDFANFHLLDARYKPNIHNALSRCHLAVHYLQYKDPEVFAKIYWLFSREAVVANSLFNYANTMPVQAADALPTHQLGLFAGGYQSIDDFFLVQLDQYREALARAFKRDNTSLDGEQLTEIVQRTIDRLVFLRFLEDKLIEPDQIVQKIASSKAPWQEFVSQSARLNGIYNGVVFKPHPMMDKSDFVVNPQNFVDICTELSDTHSPYDFNHIPVEILGRIYERFLGKVVTATAKRVNVEDKPEVRKAGGVFYTPDYIVQYMAEQALTPLLAKKKPSEVFKTRIIDTSCGSGSFLIGVYEVLLQHVGQLYFNDPTLAKAGEWLERDGKWGLSLKRKRELLVQCIYGVDIDAQAVQVAQLSLFLKLMEDETTASAALVQQEIESTLLPNLSRNIIVGNSLLSRLDDTSTEDFFASNQTMEQLVKLKAINLRTAFGEVMLKEGGFDLVIGNPPYIKEPTNKAAFDHLRGSPYYQGKMDIWYMFACRALDLLKENTGRLALIATNNWVTNAGAKAMRNKLLKDAKIEQIVDFGDYKVFKDAGIQTMILIASRANTPQKYSFDLRRLTLKKANLLQAQALLFKAPQDIDATVAGQTRLAANIDRQAMVNKPFTFANSQNDAVLDKIASKANFILNERTEVAQGIVTPQDTLSPRLHKKLFDRLGYAQGIFILSNTERRDLALSKLEQKLTKPYYTTHQLTKYLGIKQNADWIIYTNSTFNDPDSLDKYPKLKSHLDQFKTIITSSNKPYGLHRARNENFFQGEKIICLRKCKEPTFTYTDFDCYVSQTFNIIKTDRINQKYLAALLNSKLVKYWLKHKGKMQGAMYQVDKEPLLRIPLCTAGQEIEAQIVLLVEKVLELTPLVKSATLEAHRDSYLRLLEDADAAIQRMIYSVYDLTPDDITQIESGI